MRTSLWVGISAVLASQAAYAGPGIPIGHDDTVYTQDLLEASEPRRVEVTITERGPEPRDIPIDKAEKLNIVARRESDRACRFGLAVTGYGLVAPVAPGPPTTIVVLTFGRGQIHLACPMENVSDNGTP